MSRFWGQTARDIWLSFGLNQIWRVNLLRANSDLLFIKNKLSAIVNDAVGCCINSFHYNQQHVYWQNINFELDKLWLLEIIVKKEFLCGGQEFSFL